MGISRGDRVGVWGINSIEWLTLELATARVGAVLVNINPAYRVSELRHALRLAEVNFVFLMPSFRSSDYLGMILELVPEAEQAGARIEPHLFPHLHGIVVFDPADPDRRDRFAPGLPVWAEFLEAGRGVPAEAMDARRRELDPDDPINIQFTSGTTGFPKAVVLTHFNIVNNALSIGRAMGMTDRDRLCVPVPFYHCFGMVVSNLVCLSTGAAIVLPGEHFEAGATLRAISDEHCTIIHGVPTMFAAELDHPDFASFDLSSLRTGIMAGAPCPPDLMHHVREDMHCRDILIGFGQTEASPIATLTRTDDSVERRLRTVGRPIEHQECKIIDQDSGRTLPVGEQGEVCIRGYNVMRGYYAQPAETARAIDEAGWLHTGDLGTMDADGYIAITGRLKDMIIRGGENIYPAEIEAFYDEHPGIEQAAVFGVPHEKLGEEVCMWVHPRHGAALDADDLRAWAKGRIAHYKVPAHIWVVESFPMTVTGKIQKRKMNEAVVRWRAAGGSLAPKPVEQYAPRADAPAAEEVALQG
jgi:fatty-acyl-CoA synthase